jgi:transposase InsO family protein
MASGFLYLVAIIDWASRAVLAWRLSNTMDTSFCLAALDEALVRHGKPEIFNTDQGAQFTSTAFTGKLAAAAILRRRLRGAHRHRPMDELLQFPAPTSGDEQQNPDVGLARRHRRNRGGKGCGYAASLGRRKRVAHIPTARAEGAESGLRFFFRRQQ